VTTQLDLFTAPRVKPSALRVLDALRAIGGTGTAWDCMTRLGPHAQAAATMKRLSELEAAGLVVRVGHRRSPTGRGTCTCWQALP
jgi:hypothetical protein